MSCIAGDHRASPTHAPGSSTVQTWCLAVSAPVCLPIVGGAAPRAGVAPRHNDGGRNHRGRQGLLDEHQPPTCARLLPALLGWCAARGLLPLHSRFTTCVQCACLVPVPRLASQLFVGYLYGVSLIVGLSGSLCGLFVGLIAVFVVSLWVSLRSLWVFVGLIAVFVGLCGLFVGLLVVYCKGWVSSGTTGERDGWGTQNKRCGPKTMHQSGQGACDHERHMHALWRNHSCCIVLAFVVRGTSNFNEVCSVYAHAQPCAGTSVPCTFPCFGVSGARVPYQRGVPRAHDQFS